MGDNQNKRNRSFGSNDSYEISPINKCLKSHASSDHSDSAMRSSVTTLQIDEESPAEHLLTQSTMGKTSFVSTNIFESLADDDDGSQETPSISQGSGFIPPPIVVSHSEPRAQEIISHLRKKFANKVFFKYISVGIKILCKSSGIYEALKNWFAEQKVQFYSHDSRPNESKKFTVSGLADFDGAEEEIKNELAEIYGLQPIEVTKIPPKYKRFTSDCIYLISFDKGVTNIETLKKIRHLCHTCVNWRFYKSKPKPPTLCQNCYLFGHGKRNCQLPPRCRQCSGSHSTEKCKSSSFKCRNCSGAHSADDPSCPALENFIAMRRNRGTRDARSKPPRQRPPASGGNRPDDRRIKERENPVQGDINPSVPSFNDADFPPLPQRGLAKKNMRPNTSSSAHNSREDLRQESDTQVRKNQWNRNPDPAPPGSSSQSTLFKPKELLAMATELLENLHNCRSKKDQLQVLFNIVVKYLDD